MAQERLDQSCRLPIGTRDAVHVPIVSAQIARGVDSHLEDMLRLGNRLAPGCFVKFVDEEFTKFVPCDRSEAHGVLNPFIDEVSSYDNVVVMLMPGITSPVRHNFDINPKQKEWEASILESELEEARNNDPDCAGCWAIKNNQVIRN